MSNHFLGMMKQNLTPKQALEKLKQYCAYQERCHKEVIEKLATYNIYKTDADVIVVKLIQENYLNEERFAIQFAGGKFRMKQWGKIKITHQLKQKQISTANIKKALQQISKADYDKTLIQLANKQIKQYSKMPLWQKKLKAKSALLAKGYESNLIDEVLEL